MRRLAALASLLLLAGCSGWAGSADRTDDGTRTTDGGATVAATAPAPLPRVRLDSFDGGEPVELASLRGPLVLNLWASWCGPCRQEMPVLQEFSQRHEGRVEVVGVDYQDPQVDAARELVEETGVTYRLLSDVDGELDRLAPFPHLRGLPFIALVDAEGRVVHQEFVVIDDVAELEELVAEHLEVA